MTATSRMLERGWLTGYSSARTREAYAGDLAQWRTWCTGQGVDLLDATRMHVDVFRAHLEGELGRAPATVGRKLSAITGFYRYCLSVDAIAKSPAAHIRRPRVSEESSRAGLDRAELRRLEAAARAAGRLEHALVLLLAHNGLRVSEACGIRVRDLTTERGHDIVTVLGKGGKVAKVPIAPSTAAAVRALVADRQPGLNDPLLGLTRFQAKTAIVQLAAAAGIEGKRITPHSLRHTFVTLALEAGIPLHDVQDAARHSDPRTTQRYNRARHNLDRHATYDLTRYLEQDDDPDDPEPAAA